MGKWEYKGIYKKYDIDGIIHLPNGSELKVCDLINELPGFMKKADVLFIDPPCSKGNMTSFYTKADKKNENSYDRFYEFLFRRIDEIKPKILFLEVFKSNKEVFIKECKKRYRYIYIYESYYYNNKKNKCWIIQASNYINQIYNEINNIDEERVIKWICGNIEYKKIGDLCMGLGLVGKYAYLNNKSFVGIELNHKRLAILVDFIKKAEQNGKS